jgi:hypothetical protein
VHEVVELARRSGAEVTREPAETFYGGYAGVFRDLDGHAWEIAHNPGFGFSGRRERDAPLVAGRPRRPAGTVPGSGLWDTAEV